jgi:hypothetical protein
MQFVTDDENQIRELVHDEKDSDTEGGITGRNVDGAKSLR